MEAFYRGAVMLDEQRLLHFGNHQHFGMGVLGEHRTLVLGKVPIAAPATVQATAQGLRLVLEAAVGGVVHVQPWHLVEADQAVDRALGQVGGHPGAELLVAAVVENRLHRRHQHFEARRNVTLPDQRIHTDLVAPLLAFQGNAHEIALQPAEGEIFVKHESQLHQRTSSASSNALKRLATCSGFRRVKHSGHSRFRSNRARSSARGL